MHESIIKRVGDWSQTYTGKMFYPLDPRPEDVCIEDIAHHLSLICRYNGACLQPYSVAEHSVRVAAIVPPADRKWALLHDAAEAYTCDLIRPLKRTKELGEPFALIESKVQAAITQCFGLQSEIPALVLEADNILLMTEVRDLMHKPPVPWHESKYKPLEKCIKPMPWYEAKSEFLLAYENYFF